MHQAVEQPHVGVAPEGCLIACKTVALKITLEVILICQGPNDLARNDGVFDRWLENTELPDLPYDLSRQLLNPAPLILDLFRLISIGGRQ